MFPTSIALRLNYDKTDPKIACNKSFIQLYKKSFLSVNK